MLSTIGYWNTAEAMGTTIPTSGFYGTETAIAQGTPTPGGSVTPNGLTQTVIAGYTLTPTATQNSPHDYVSPNTEVWLGLGSHISPDEGELLALNSCATGDQTRGLSLEWSYGQVCWDFAVTGYSDRVSTCWGDSPLAVYAGSHGGQFPNLPGAQNWPGFNVGQLPDSNGTGYWVYWHNSGSGGGTLIGYHQWCYGLENYATSTPTVQVTATLTPTVTSTPQYGCGMPIYIPIIPLVDISYPIVEPEVCDIFVQGFQFNIPFINIGINFPSIYSCVRWVKVGNFTVMGYSIYFSETIALIICLVLIKWLIGRQ
jgi:hypothetical protein